MFVTLLVLWVISLYSDFLFGWKPTHGADLPQIDSPLAVQVY